MQHSTSKTRSLSDLQMSADTSEDAPLMTRRRGSKSEASKADWIFPTPEDLAAISAGQYVLFRTGKAEETWVEAIVGAVEQGQIRVDHSPTSSSSEMIEEWVASRAGSIRIKPKKKKALNSSSSSNNIDTKMVDDGQEPQVRKSTREKKPAFDAREYENPLDWDLDSDLDSNLGMEQDAAQSSKNLSSSTTKPPEAAPIQRCARCKKLKRNKKCPRQWCSKCCTRQPALLPCPVHKHKSSPGPARAGGAAATSALSPSPSTIDAASFVADRRTLSDAPAVPSAFQALLFVTKEDRSNLPDAPAVPSAFQALILAGAQAPRGLPNAPGAGATVNAATLASSQVQPQPQTIGGGQIGGQTNGGGGLNLGNIGGGSSVTQGLPHNPPNSTQ